MPTERYRRISVVSTHTYVILSLSVHGRPVQQNRTSTRPVQENTTSTRTRVLPAHATSLMYGASWRPQQGVLHRGPAQLCCLGPRMTERRTACLQRRTQTGGRVRSSKITSRVVSNSSACTDPRDHGGRPCPMPPCLPQSETSHTHRSLFPYAHKKSWRHNPDEADDGDDGG